LQAEDGIRDDLVTGVQTCALPISPSFGSDRPAWSAARASSHAGAWPPWCAVHDPPPSAPLPRSGGTTHSPRGTLLSAHRSSDQEIGRASCRERGWIEEIKWPRQKQ